MKIHKEGYSTIAIMFLAIAATLFSVNFFNPQQTLVHYFLYLLAAGFFIFIVRFFRNPVRPVDRDNSILISPADGKIVVIDETWENEYFGDRRIQVSIFMSPNNVHKNWYPTDGDIKYYRHHPGKFLVAWHPKSSEFNERTTVVIKRNDGMEILLRQIAGAVAQRISCYAEENKRIKQGEELGFIKFGSRVDIFLPLGTKIKVQKDQKVKGCIDVIASL
ncbi:MAG: phosphatidylserine decarboxylase family protein [Bacteroidales bacterium]|nr:phosphatidylserine decarboxylase family protein [Bacteroidales bacterium]